MNTLLYILFEAVNGIKSEECEFRVQIVQVQDGTSTFLKELKSLRKQNLVEILMDDLSNEFGKVEFGLTMYQDKPTTVTGYGVNDGWWNKEVMLQSGYNTDKCYDLIQPLTEDPIKANDAFDYFHSGGGKDVMENQWDALRRSAIDSKIGWDLRSHDDDGSPIIRLAVLVTDDAAHTAHNVFKDQPRNMNHEYYMHQGPYKSLSRMGYTGKQECNLTESIRLENNIRNQPTEATSIMNDGGECYGWSNSIAGARRSLKGILGYYNYYYGFGDTARKVDIIECTGLLNKGSPCWEYSAFINCCTHWGNTVSYGCYYDHDMYYRFPDYNSCIEYGGRYARCHPTQGPAGCTNITEEWEIAQFKDPSLEFFTGLGIANDSERVDWINKIDNITDYPYDDSIFNKDCTTFEYPDPTSYEYAEPFLNRAIIPLIVAAPPSKSVMNSEDASTSTIASYDYQALRMSGHNCPGLEWDPWTTYMCSRYGESVCYSPNNNQYFGLYPNKYSWGNSEFWKEGFGCWTEECAQQWWSQCYDVEYGYPISKLKEHGVEVHYHMMDANYDAEIIINNVLNIVRETLNEKECITSTTISTTTTMTKSILIASSEEVTVYETSTILLNTAEAASTSTKDAIIETTITTMTDMTTNGGESTSSEIISGPTTSMDVNSISSNDDVESAEDMPESLTTESSLIYTTITTETVEPEEWLSHDTTSITVLNPHNDNTNLITSNQATSYSSIATTSTSTTILFEPPPSPPTQPPAEEEADNRGIIIVSAIGSAGVLAAAVVIGLMVRGIIPLPISKRKSTTSNDVIVDIDSFDREVIVDFDDDMFV